MNAPRKKSAVTRHFGQPYQTLDELRAGLKADESEYTDAEIEEIMEAIRQKAAEASGSDTSEQKATPAPAIDVNSISKEEYADFQAWKAQQNGLKASSTAELAKAIASPAPKPSRYKDYDVFAAQVKKGPVDNPFNPERPNVVTSELVLGERKRTTRIEPALAHEFNEYAMGQEVNINHGNVSTAEFYFPKDKYAPGARIPFTEFAEFQRQDIRYADKYHPRKNISLLVAAGYGMPIV